MKVLFVISDLGLGGAQRVISILSNHWAKQSINKVSIITFRNFPSVYDLSNVNRIKLNIPKSKKLKFTENYTRIKKLRAAFKECSPDVIISFITENNILAILASRYTNIPIIISERSNPFVEKLSLPWVILRKICYPFADLLVLQTEGVKQFYKNYNIEKANIKNPLSLIGTKEKEKKEKIIISTGRLTPSKNFDLLIRSFAKLSNRTGWRLIILGEGSDRMRLEDLIKELSLASSVTLKGSVENIFEWLMNSEIFVLLSKYEGYPNALIEAMASGLAVISNDCDFGPAEIIMHNQNGLLVNAQNEKEVIRSMEELIANSEKRKQLGSKAKEICSSLNIESIALKWEQAIANIKQ